MAMVGMPRHGRWLFVAITTLTFVWLFHQRVPDRVLPGLPGFSASVHLAEDAHKFATADDFLPHFKEVSRLPGISLKEARSTCTWPEGERINFQFSDLGDVDWMKKDRDEEELKFRRTQWQNFISKDLIPWEPNASRFSGRGLVIVAGRSRSMGLVRVMLRALAKLGSEIPVEIHHYGPEMSASDRQSVLRLWPGKLYFNDLSAADNLKGVSNYTANVNNYQLKTAALVNSRFAEILFLDSDNIPLVKPEDLFESETYREYGTVFWPDIARTRPNNPIWSITNTHCRMDEWEQESGQILVNKTKFFYHLQLAAWMNNEQEWYYYQMLLGDKDMFRYAWDALKTAYGKPDLWVTSVGTLNDDGFYCGHTFAHHHPDGKDAEVAFMHASLIKVLPKAVVQYQRGRGGLHQAYKKDKYSAQPEQVIHVGVVWDQGEYVPNRKEDQPTTWCIDYYDAEAKTQLGDLGNGVGMFEETFKEIGGYWMFDNDNI